MTVLDLEQARAKRAQAPTRPSAPTGVLEPTKPPVRGPVPNRSTRPVRTARATAPPASRARRPARMPFVLLVVGLMGGGLVTLLLLNTILAQGSFALDAMQKRNAVLTHRAQALEQHVARAESPARLAARARALGMVPVGRAGFVDVKTGKVYGHPAPGLARPQPAAQSGSAAARPADAAEDGRRGTARRHTVRPSGRVGHRGSDDEAHREQPGRQRAQGGPSPEGGQDGHEDGHR